MLNSDNVLNHSLDTAVFSEPPIIKPEVYFMFVANLLTPSLQQMWRVKLLDDGNVKLYDFNFMKQEKNLSPSKCLNMNDLPKWIKDRLAILQLTDDGNPIEGVGCKLSDTVFYVVGKEQC